MVNLRITPSGTVTHLNDVLLGPADQISFWVDVIPLTQQKIWELRTAAELGLSNIATETEGALEICLEDNLDSDSAPEVISISRKALLGGGLSASAKVAAGASVFGIGKGGKAGIGGSVIVGSATRDRFGFPYDTTNFDENVAKLDLLLYPVTQLSPALMILQGGLEATLLPQYRDELEAGLYLKLSGWAEAWLQPGLDLPIPKLGFYLGGNLPKTSYHSISLSSL